MEATGGMADTGDEQGKTGPPGAGTGADCQLPQSPLREPGQFDRRQQGCAGTLEAFRCHQCPQFAGIDSVWLDPDQGTRGITGETHGTGWPEERELHLEQLQRRLGRDLGELLRIADGDRLGVIGLDTGKALQLPVEPITGIDQLLLDPREARDMRLQVDEFGLEYLWVGVMDHDARGNHRVGLRGFKKIPVGRVSAA